MSIRKKSLAALTATAAVMAAVSAFAGVIDSPVPSISDTASTRVLFLVPGVIKNNGIESAVICTSLDSVDGMLALEVFAPEGGVALNDVAAGNGRMPIAVGESVTLSTGTSVGLHEDQAIVGLGNVKNGSARILSTSSRVVCTGLLVEKLGSTPNTIANLRIIARRKQNGD